MRLKITKKFNHLSFWIFVEFLLTPSHSTEYGKRNYVWRAWQSVINDHMVDVFESTCSLVAHERVFVPVCIRNFVSHWMVSVNTVATPNHTMEKCVQGAGMATDDHIVLQMHAHCCDQLNTYRNIWIVLRCSGIEFYILLFGRFSDRKDNISIWVRQQERVFRRLRVVGYVTRHPIKFGSLSRSVWAYICNRRLFD